MAGDAPADAAPNSAGGFWGFLLPVLGAIATGISVIGFVIFFGGMVAWARYDAVGLPANQAVSRVPRAELVVTGASFLIVAVLGALAAVAAAGAIAYMGTFRWIPMRQVPKRRSLDAATAATTVAKGAVASAKTGVTRAEKHEESCRLVANVAPAGERNQALRALEASKSTLDAARMTADDADQTLQTAVSNEQQAEAAHKKAGEPTGADRGFIAAAGLLSLGAADYVAAQPSKISDSLILWCVAAVATVLISLVILDATRKWGWFAVAGFLSVGIAIGLSAFLRTHEHPKIASVAIVRTSGSPQIGFLVTRTSDGVIVGVPSISSAGDTLVGTNTQMVEVPSDKIVDMAVGPEVAANSAYRRALEIGEQLCSQPSQMTGKQQKTSKVGKKQKKKSGKSNTNQPPATECSQDQLSALDSELKRAKLMPGATR